MATATKTTKTKENEKAGEGKKDSPLVKRLTEKGALLAEKGQYTFAVPEHFNKRMVANMVKKEYKVTPIRVNIIAPIRKTVTRRKGRPGVWRSEKKAIVTIQKGEKIKFV